MGRCGECRQATQRFCCVHQQFICESCLISPSTAHATCVIRSYRQWFENQSYEWPPLCAKCNTDLRSRSPVVRLSCLHVMHVRCLSLLVQTESSCPTCKHPLVPEPEDKSVLAENIRKVLAKPAPEKFTPSQSTSSVGATSQACDTVTSTSTSNRAAQRVPFDSRAVSNDSARTSSSRLPAYPPRKPVPIVPPKDTRLDLGSPSKNSNDITGSAKSRGHAAEKFLILTMVWLRLKVFNPLKGEAARLMSSAAGRKITRMANREVIQLRNMWNSKKHRPRIIASVLVASVVILMLILGGGNNAPKEKDHGMTLPNVRVNPNLVPPHPNNNIAVHSEKDLQHHEIPLPLHDEDAEHDAHRKIPLHVGEKKGNAGVQEQKPIAAKL